MEHGHQQLGQDNNHNDVVGAYDQCTHERAKLLCVGDAGDEECNMCQGEYVPEQSIARPHEPVKWKEQLDFSGHVGNMSARSIA